ncbi:ATP-dependent RNA helicase mtr4 [Smittium mucronatum]|uniref:ATP-dependent RNA helicase mtr4 n=1 Tax=Smittium mucronatum TaxID=133383 RepID=A0A1R0GMH3_9FUNG|nr:ATP-dependent RNA helicase mtr4 [Smittium mucronatum]OLY81443.1 ATP-dependent RNA helicase mtr4 [Smittium mucronatum]
MDVNKLFGVFDEAPSSDSDSELEIVNEENLVNGNKRELEEIDTHDSINDSKKTKTFEIDNSQIGQDVEEELVKNPSISQRYPKNDSEKAIVLDTFEEDLQRNVEPAGLDTSAADEKGQILLTHLVRHQVAIPPGYNYIPLNKHVRPNPPAREYPFELDPFQQASISCIERNESVLVAAHTSAGKTVVAEYAISQSLKNKQRVIYTSPIKALSNQKYREFLEEFGDVGLMTGDVTINPSASCLVMTTEILRSMLYRGSEIMREVAWVVFDEVHYMRDKERGVVWEETIILLPHNVHFVFLSATIPNAMEFAEWITKLHKQPCHVVYTDFRPTPLQHYLFPSGGDGIHLVVDEKGQFREENFKRAINALQEAQGSAADDINSIKGKSRGKGPKTNKGSDKRGPSDIFKIVKMIMVKNYNPVIVFSFSKRDCESLALQMSKLDFNSEDEKNLVNEVFTNAISSLSEEDRKLPQIEHIIPLLKRGIGIHHSGLLPILKEVIEILFQEGLLKCLFATETFSIGLNMPARTVVFTSVRKFDGKEFRWVTGGEYIQMSGRAGRRGIDDRGVVILMVDEKMEPPVAMSMVKGNPDQLNSAFHLSYNMILNLMRVETFTPEFMLESSFHQFQAGSNLPILENKLIEAEKEVELASENIENEPEAKRFYEIRTQLESLKKEIHTIIMEPSNSLPFLQPGRLARVCIGSLDFGWGIIVGHQKAVMKEKKRGASDSPPEYIVDILMHCKQVTPDYSGAKLDNSINPNKQKLPVIPCDINDNSGVTIVTPVLLNCVENLSSVRMFLPKSLIKDSDRNDMRKKLAEVDKRFSKDIPLLDPVKNMKITDKEFIGLIKKLAILEEKLFEHPIYGSPMEAEIFQSYSKKLELQNNVLEMRRHIMDSKSVLQLDELKARKRVLRKLGLTNNEDVIEVKGRVACEITSGDELILTELIFNGVFNDLTIEQIVALLSCFVFQEKSKDESPRLATELATPLRIMQETARRVAQISTECKLTINEEEYVSQFKPELMDVVYAWANGAKFIQICKMTSAFEGSIIRAFRRLEELLRQMCMASKAIGNTDLENKFASGIVKIKRDIVFAASLYL